MRTRVFRNKEKLDELVDLLNNDLSHSFLARYFECDRSTIIYWAHATSHYVAPPPGRILREKTYADYLEADRVRKEREKMSPHLQAILEELSRPY